jgi:hypothetical protein
VPGPVCQAVFAVQRHGPYVALPCIRCSHAESTLVTARGDAVLIEPLQEAAKARLAILQSNPNMQQFLYAPTTIIFGCDRALCKLRQIVLCANYTWWVIFV